MPAAQTPAVLHSYPSVDDLKKDLLNFVLNTQFHAIEKKGRFTLAISGGSLPKTLTGLAGPVSERIEWDKWHVFLVDERVVRLDHPDSNYNLVRTELFSKVPIPEKNVHPINFDDIISARLEKLGKTDVDDETIDSILADLDEDEVDEIAEEYRSQLVSEFVQKDSVRFPVFDLILLGMGDDGHTASLFPEHALLGEPERWVAPITDSRKPPPIRVTLTLPVINHASKVAFVITGDGKAAKVAEALDRPEAGLPPSRVKPRAPGKVFWFVDDAAAAEVQYPRSPFAV